jgi:hypothetical protein
MQIYQNITIFVILKKKLSKQYCYYVERTDKSSGYGIH